MASDNDGRGEFLVTEFTDVRSDVEMMSLVMFRQVSTVGVGVEANHANTMLHSAMLVVRLLSLK